MFVYMYVYVMMAKLLTVLKTIKSFTCKMLYILCVFMFVCIYNMMYVSICMYLYVCMYEYIQYV